MDHQEDFKPKKRDINRGILTPNLLAEHKKLESLKRQIGKVGSDALLDVLTLDNLRARIRLETARAFAAEEGIDEDFLAGEDAFGEIDTYVNEAAEKQLAAA